VEPQTRGWEVTDIEKMDPSAIIDELWDMLNCEDGCPDCAPIRERLDALKAALTPTGEIGEESLQWPPRGMAAKKSPSPQDKAMGGGASAGHPQPIQRVVE
jgi:hypothetical protein